MYKKIINILKIKQNYNKIHKSEINLKINKVHFKKNHLKSFQNKILIHRT